MVDIPSILKQTDYRASVFDFGRAKTPDVRFFNCSVVRRNDGLWLIARRSHTVPRLMVGMNDVVALQMGENKLLFGGKKIGFPRTLREQHHEDPRACWMNGAIWVSATTFQVNRKRNGWTGAHQCIGRVNQDWQVDFLADPMFGKNGGSPLMNTGNEKNWIWFEHDGEPHFVYTSQPHCVVRMNRDMVTPAQTWETENKWIWDYGEIRGGTPPVRVGDEYFTFFHSSTPWNTRQRRYHMGALSFEAKPPFAVTRVSKRPILSGSKEDEWYQGLPLVVFPCGAIPIESHWLITLGVNDCTSAWIEIPHEEVFKTRSTKRRGKETIDGHEVHHDVGGASVDGVPPQPGAASNGHGVAQQSNHAIGPRHGSKRKPRKDQPVASGSH